MFKRSLPLLIASLFIFTNVTASYAFHSGGSGALTAEADTHTGSAGFAVPIDVPPGRAGIQPNIQLQYNSNLPNSLLGAGWSLELGSIQRSTHKGVPSYTDSDEFVLIQSGGSQELVYDASAGFYRTETEGAFLKIEFVGNSYWRVTDKKGMRYYFGEDQTSREYDPANTARVFKWALNKIEDLHGNTMTLTYWRDGNKLYPQYIDYTSNPSNSLAAFARIEFVWVPRADPLTGYTTGFNVQVNYRLERIDARVGIDLQYRFVLNYHQSNATGRSILEKITQYGADGTSTLPPLTFQYQEYVDELPPAYTMTSYNNGASLPQFAGDFNGDGLTDIGRYTPATGKLEVTVSQGTSFGAIQTWYPALVMNAQVLVGNFDSDGINDVVAFNPGNGRWTVALAKGTGFDNKGTWQDSFGVGEKPGVGDFNGDGLTDIMAFYESAGDLRCRVAINKGGSFEPLSGVQNLHVGSASGGIPYAADFNGDGLLDFTTFYKSTGDWVIRLNKGNLSLIQLNDLSGFGSNKETVVADFNMDGLTDVGYYDYSLGKILYKPFKNSAFGDGTWAAFTFTNLTSSSVRVQAMDFNGDGLPDFAAQNDVGDMEIAYSNGVFPDLLVKSDNGVGGTTTIEYAPSTTFNNPQLPFPLQLVKSASQSNNLGDVYTTRYDYGQGLWDGADREFRGFGLVRTTDPDGNYSETVFAQDGIYKGRVTEQRTYDSSGNGKLYGKTLHTWAYEEVAAGSNFIYLKRKDNFVYDGDATGRRTAEEFFFGETPQMGNLTRAVQLGEVDLSTGSDIGNDTRAMETTYVQNTSGSNWIAGLPRQTTVKDNAGNVVRQAWFYYDNQGNTAAPVKGLLTKKEDWAGTGQVNPVTQYTYDTVGNLLTTTDPKGNITRVTYDTAYQTFPLTTENALGHKVISEYYGVNGVPLSGGGFNGLWGQVKSTTDPNNQAGKRVYDVFGRATAAISPLDSIAFPTQTTSIEFLGSYTKVTTRQRVERGKAQTIDSVGFIDGFGRLAQVKARSEVTGRYVINGQTQYDSRGLKSRQYLPAFTTNPMDVIDFLDTAKPHTLITYDAMGRPVRTTNPDGTFASVSYDDWAATATDENGHRQKSYFDAYGRLIKKEEYLGADGRSPAYPAKPYTLYATTLYTYDSEGNLLQTKDAYNNITTITYDALGRKVAMDDPDMGRWSYQYDLNSNLTKQIDAKGQTLTFTYDALNRLTNKTDGVNGTVNVNYTYDSASNTNSKGRLTQAAYAGGNTQFAYDELGRELQSIKAMNTTNYGVTRGYDALNNLLQIQYPDQKNIYYKYNDAGQIEAISNDATILPQSFNRQAETEQVASLVSRRSYLVRDTKYEIRDTKTFLSAVGEWFERNILGVGEAYAQASPPLPSPWVEQDIGSVGVAGSTGYASGVFTVNGSGTDIWGSGDKFHFVYQPLNGDGEIIARVDSVQNTYSWAKAGVMMRENLTPGSRNAFMLMSATQGTSFQRRKTAASSTSYTSGGTSLRAPYWVKLVRSGDTFKAYQSANGTTWTQVGPTETITMTQTIYIGLAVTSHANTVLNTSLFSSVQVSTGLVAPVLNTATAGSGEVSLSWNAVAGATGYRVYYGTTPDMPAATPSIDAGNATSSTVRDLTNGTAYYFAAAAYNSFGQGPNSNTMSATPAAPVVTEYPTLFIKNVDYNAAGQMTKVEYGNGDVTTYTYNPLNLRLTRLYTVDKNGTALQDLNYTYDSVGNILSITDNVNTADQTFKYDELNRLTEAAGQGYGTKTYVYDTIGNIVQKDGKTYFYGDGAAAGPHAVTSLSDGTTFTYDADGNMINKVEVGVTTNYKYDSENRLIEVKKGGSIIGQYTYDGDGGRTTKVATVSGQTTTTTFVGSLFETSGSRNTKYVFLGGQRVAAVTNSPSIGSTTLYYHTDHLGGANILTDSTGFKKELIEYEPFGVESRHEKYGSSEEIAWYYFTGKKTDDESGLIYFGARYYDPSLGRFITPDTYIPGFSNPQALNRYSYCLNNPINRIDPDGHWSWKKFFKSFVSAFVQIATTIVLTPFIGPIAAGAVGGFLGGALNAGLNGASFGQAMMSGLVGAGIGALGGAAFGSTGVNGFLGSAGPAVGIGLLVVGGAYSAATGNLDSFAGGLTGGIGGYVAGQGALNSNALKNNPSVKSYHQAQRQAQRNNNSLKTDQKPSVLNRGSGLSDKDASNFAGGKYDTVTFKETKVLYRGHAEGGEVSPWMTDIKPSSEIQLRMDYAIKGEWTPIGQITQVSTYEIPAGTYGFTGKASYQGLFYFGGNDQYYIMGVKREWIVNTSPMGQ